MEVSGKLCEKGNVIELCEPCTVENVSTQADGFCKECDEFMCQKCFGYHLRGKYCRNHVLDPISGSQLQRKLRTQEEKCKTHTSESVKYYCSFHDFIGCGDCIVSNHRKCEPEFIRDLSLNLEESSELKSLKSQLQNSDVEKAEIETRIARYRKNNNMLVAKALRNIREFRRDIDCWLDKMETDIEAEVRTISDANETTFSELQQMIVEVSDDIERINQLLDSNIHHGENLFIRMIECKPHVRDVDKTLSEVKSKLVFERYTFEQGKDMKEMMKSLDKLGSIKVIKMTENEQSTEDFNVPSLAEWSCIDTETKPEDGFAGLTSYVQDFEYPLRAELEEELENIRQKAVSEKEHMQQEYNKLKKELEVQEDILSREQENSKVVTTERDQTIVLLKQHEQEIGSLKDLNTSLNSQLDSRNKEYRLLVSNSRARHDQDKSTNDSLQAELKKNREEYTSLSRQIRDLELQRESANNNIRDLQQQRESAMREISSLKVQLKQKDEGIILFKQEVSSLKYQLDNRNTEFVMLESTNKARQEQDNNKIKSLQSELSKISEKHEIECKRLSSQIQDLQHQRESAVKTYQLPDPRAAGFDVGKRVIWTAGPPNIFLGQTGTVTAVNPSGYVNVKWGNSWESSGWKAGAGGEYDVKLL